MKHITGCLLIVIFIYFFPADKGVFSETNLNVVSNNLSQVETRAVSELAFDVGGISLSKPLPKPHERIKINIVLTNSGGVEAAQVTVRLFGDDPAKGGKKIGETQVERVPAYKTGAVRIDYTTPSEDGIYRLWAVIDPDNKISEKDKKNNIVSTEIAVVAKDAKDLYFALWPSDYAEPAIAKSPKYANSIILQDKMVKTKEGREYWENRGVVICKAMGGEVNYRRHGSRVTAEELAAHWGNIEPPVKGIDIDEFGADYGGWIDIMMCNALKICKTNNPSLFIIAYNAGPMVPCLARGYKEAAVLAVQEKYIPIKSSPSYVISYLNLFGIDSALVGGLIDKTLIILGAHKRWLYPDKYSVKEQLAHIEDQVRYIRTRAPQMPGIMFFSSPKENPELYHGLDRLCYKYFIMPVLSVSDKDLSFSNPNPRQGEKIEIKLSLLNIGAMHIKNLLVKFYDGDPKAKASGQLIGERRSDVSCGTTTITMLWKPEGKGEHCVFTEIFPSDEITFLRKEFPRKRLYVGEISCSEPIAYHVANEGDDGNAGTVSSPFKTLARAVKNLNPGDSVIIHKGSYQEVVDIFCSGTKDKRITLKAAPGEDVIIRGGEPSRIEGFNPVSWTNKVFEVKTPYSFSAGFIWEEDTGSPYRRVWKLKNIGPSMYFYDDKAKVLYIHTSDGKEPSCHTIKEVANRAYGLKIRGNYITIEGLKFGYFGQAGICIERPSSYITIASNTLFSSGTGLYLKGADEYEDISRYENFIDHIKIIDNAFLKCDKGINAYYLCCDLEIRKNTFNNNFNGIYMYAPVRVEIADNICYANRQGISLVLGWGETIMTNNICHSNKGVGITVSSSISPIRVVNNRCYSNGGNGIEVYKIPSGLILEENVCYKNEGNGGGLYDVHHSKIIKNILSYNQGEESHGLVLSGKDASTHNLIENNIMVKNKGCGIYVTPQSMGTNMPPSMENVLEGTVINQNCIWENEKGNYSQDVPKGSNDIALDPLFKDPAKGDFSLDKKSPCLKLKNGGAE